jgi:hypothetical protein
MVTFMVRSFYYSQWDITKDTRNGPVLASEFSGITTVLGKLGSDRSSFISRWRLLINHESDFAETALSQDPIILIPNHQEDLVKLRSFPGLTPTASTPYRIGAGKDICNRLARHVV